MTMIEVDHLLTDGIRPIIDVRSPSEFDRGHLPGASNVPLFDDNERAEIGTLYKQSGRDPAIARGLEIATPKVDRIIHKIERLARRSPFVVHCWRGGLRSQAVTWLCEHFGLHPVRLEGGYKQFRRCAHDCFEQPRQVIILAGPTGTGKTLILQSMRDAGEQVIDLEDLACHRGSVFGGLPGRPQPTVEQFENNLFLQWRDLDPEKRVWIEGESKAIGTVMIPDGVWQQMLIAPMVYVDADRDARVDFLLEQYGEFDKSNLSSAVTRLKKRLGGARLTAALEAIDQSDWRSFCSIVLEYYDRSYAKSLERNPRASLQRLDLSSPGESAAVAKLVACSKDLVMPDRSSTLGTANSIE